MSTAPSEQTTFQAPTGDPVVEVRDLAVHFGGVKAVDGLSMSLHPGLVYGIIGPNGSGKSTLIGAMTRLTQFTRGDLLIDGKSYRNAAPNRLAAYGVARTFQTVRLLPDLDVQQNIQVGSDARVPADGEERPSLGRRALGLVSNAVAPAVTEAIRRTGLEGFEKYYPSELSYGTQRRVEIARAIAMNPRLLLLDEPTAGMNQKERAEISGLLKDMRSEGLCQLLVEHDVQMMIDTCDYVFAMNSGRIIAEGEPAEVVRDPQVQEAYLGRKWRGDA